MDLKAANLADERAWRWTRASMIACFGIASILLLASLATANGFTISHTDKTAPLSTPIH
jgi:hypothetical protein